MTDAQGAVGMDRLPWLDDEPARPPRDTIRPAKIKLPPKATGGRELVSWAAAAALLVAGGSFWLGTKSAREPTVSVMPPTSKSTVRLPSPIPDAQPQVPVVTAPEVEQAPVPTVAVPKSPATRTFVRKRKLSPMEMKGGDLSKTIEAQESSMTPDLAEPPSATTPTSAATSAPAATAAPTKAPLRLWPSTESKGATGRVVRIGAFGSRDQAKIGWRRMQQAYPAVGRLPATVVADHNSRGRTFYRFQIGTTSQAHSEVLCQRMQTIRFSCAVVGLPWKAKVER